MPRATSLAAAIRSATGIESIVEPGEHGEFTVIADGKTIFSKHDAGRFPEQSEILRALHGLRKSTEINNRS